CPRLCRPCVPSRQLCPLLVCRRPGTGLLLPPRVRPVQDMSSSSPCSSPLVWCAIPGLRVVPLKLTNAPHLTIRHPSIVAGGGLQQSLMEKAPRAAAAAEFAQSMQYVVRRIQRVTFIFRSGTASWGRHPTCQECAAGRMPTPRVRKHHVIFSRLTFHPGILIASANPLYRVR